MQPTAPLKDSPRSKAKATMQPLNNADPNRRKTAKNPRRMDAPTQKRQDNIIEQGGWAAGTQMEEGRPVQLSRTQRDKDRKKRSKAKVMIEHVDIIKDEFWEKRPWILSGKIG
jgi:hypothetical protein